MRLHPGRAARRLAAHRPGARPARDADRDRRPTPACRSTLRATTSCRSRGARGWSRVSGALRARVTVEPGSRLSVVRRGRAATRASSRSLIVRHRAQRLGSRDRPQGRGRADRGGVRPRERRRHGLRGPPRVQGARARRPPRRATQARACASTCPTGCSRSRSPRTRSTRGRPSRSSPAAWPASGPTTRPSTPPPSATRRRRCATAPTSKLMRAFLEPEVFEGGVHLRRTDGAAQGSLLGDL